LLCFEAKHPNMLKGNIKNSLMIFLKDFFERFFEVDSSDLRASTRNKIKKIKENSKYKYKFSLHAKCLLHPTSSKQILI